MRAFDSHKLIEIEGDEVTNHPLDHGGLTKYGISQRSYPHLDIANLTLSDANKIYKTDFWDKYELSSITSQIVANQLLLLIVNTGAYAAIRIIQTACVRRGMKLTIDGILGKITISAINMCNPFSLSESIRIAECQHYLSIVDHDKSQEIFFRGWIRRALL